MPFWHRDSEHVEKAFDFGGMGARNGVAGAMMVQTYSEIPMYRTSARVMIQDERTVRLDTARQGGKPENVIGKIVDGQISKWMKEICLLDQTWVKDDKKDISTLLTELVSKIGENCKIRRFTRYELGEGLEKKKDDFAAEVAKQAGLA